MITCVKSDTLTIASGCVPDVGVPVPVTWSDPQPSGLIISGWDPSVFGSLGGCGAGAAIETFNGKLPVRSTTNAFNLKYWPASLVPGSTPLFVQTAGCIVECAFISGSHWKLGILCSATLDPIWVGWKLVGETPLGTYMAVAGNSSATPDCLHVVENTFDWSPMVWVPFINQPSGTGTAVGAAGTFAVSASAATPVSNSGQITGTMTYTGPVVGCRVRVTVTGADTGGFSSFRVRVNGNTITVVPTVGFAVGVTDHYFTIQDPANPGSPLVGATIEVRALAATNVVGNSPAFSGVLT